MGKSPRMYGKICCNQIRNEWVDDMSTLLFRQRLKQLTNERALEILNFRRLYITCSARGGLFAGTYCKRRREATVQRSQQVVMVSLNCHALLCKLREYVGSCDSDLFD
mmetsp:Transcript_24686/g.60656  ORF Transcript_24686/g.60656 Transcript_24686/m.60656 type:complete len:108 (-) Transcript_24686:374-697(-)